MMMMHLEGEPYNDDTVAGVYKSYQAMLLDYPCLKIRLGVCCPVCAYTTHVYGDDASHH